MDISVYSLATVSRHAAESMPDGGAIATMTYYGGERVVSGYNMMGVCKAALDASVKYLAYDLGPKNIRINAVSAGPVKTLAASAVGDSDKLAGLYEAVSPIGRNITREEVGSAGLFILSDLARDHRRDPARRLRLQRDGFARSAPSRPPAPARRDRPSSRPERVDDLGIIVARHPVDPRPCRRLPTKAAASGVANR